jgi:hypothetical protein
MENPASPENQPQPPSGELQPALSEIDSPPVATPATPPATVTPATPLPAEPPSSPTAQPGVPAAANGPQVADDVDVIEKEWVDKAEAIVEQTKQDPHAEEEAVEDLQIDYLKKRYGKDIKKSQD